MIKAADTDVITGSKATGTMIDETHVFAKKGNAADVFVELRGALTKRSDGFLFQATTQSKQPPSGVFASELAMARSVRDGKTRMPLLPVLYELPDRLVRDGGWKDRRYWPLVNPNLGLSTNEDFLAREVLRAEQDGPAAVALIASQHFNVQIGMSLRADGWAGANYWGRGTEDGLTLDAVIERSEAVVVGIDGGGLDDLLGIAVIGREKDTKRHLAWTHALVSPEGLERRKQNAGYYEIFQVDGDLTVVNELPDDISFVIDIVDKVKASKKLAGVGVDAVGIGGIVDALAKIGITQEAGLLAGVRQGISLMGAIKTVERKLVDGSFKHGGQALMAWCAGNARIVPTPTGMRVARDDSGFGKIDPLMALFNAAALLALNLATATVFALAAPAQADIIVDLGVNPNSGQGAFANTNPGTGGGGSGTFADRYTFTLLGGPQFLTIASVTNVFASADQFIDNFTGSVVFEGADNAIGGGDDVVVIGPVLAAACLLVPDCQGFAGSAILGAGDYHLLITGDAAVNAGYGGNLSVAEVPGPIVGAGLPGLILGCLTLLGLGRLRRRAV
jgi:phage terminase large subunit-like protein